MRTLAGIEELEAPATGSAVTIGTFDGLHLGHRALILRTVNHAFRNDLASALVTWDRHPNAILRPDRVPPLLTSSSRKAELVSELGVDALALLHFDEELSRWPPERFATQVLARGLGARWVCVGRGWRFGSGAAGDVALLGELGRGLGFEVETLPLVTGDGGRVSSSRVRAAVIEGRMDEARALLDRPFDLEGLVVRGVQRGRSLGYPTANLDVDPALARPARGVYAGEAVALGTHLKAAINVGFNPQFEDGEGPLRIEVHLLDFDDDLYGERIRVEFHRRLRDELRFPSVEDLLAQMALDVEAARGATW